MISYMAKDQGKFGPFNYDIGGTQPDFTQGYKFLQSI